MKYLILKKENLIAELLDSITDESLSKTKIENYVKSELENVVKQDEEIVEWIKIFISDEWLTTEETRIKEFEMISVNLESFPNDPIIERKVSVPSANEGDITFVKPIPQGNIGDALKSIQNIIPKYVERALKLLDAAKRTWERQKLTEMNSKKIIEFVYTFKPYWRYLSNLREMFLEVFFMIKKYDYSPTVRFVISGIISELYQIDLQFWYQQKIKGLKNIKKMLLDEL